VAEGLALVAGEKAEQQLRVFAHHEVGQQGGALRPARAGCKKVLIGTSTS
jgi:hypothetical protein